MQNSKSDSVLQIFKFGGTALGADALKRAAAVVKNAAPQVVVVTSASGAATSLLLEAARRAKAGQVEEALRMAKAYADQQLQLIREVISSSSAAEELSAIIGRDAAELSAIYQSIGVLKELTPRMMDAVQALVARAAARLFASILGAGGCAGEIHRRGSADFHRDARGQPLAGFPQVRVRRSRPCALAGGEDRSRHAGRSCIGTRR